jgi:pimeloyl-ACP methyl ester carboxylesterase
MRRVRSKQLGCLVALSAAVLTMPGATSAQSLNDVKPARKPLVLKALGSLILGGRTVVASPSETGLYGGGSLIVDQMYVQYMIPDRARGTSIVMIPGGGLTAKSYETTPDGRMGWYEYFVRRGFPSYVVDQVGRGRSGFNQIPFNGVRAGKLAPDTQPNLRRSASEVAWTRFRFGPAAGVKFLDTKFPVEAALQFAKQTVPDLSVSPQPDDPNYTALSELAKGIMQTVLIGHSQSGRFPFEVTLRDPEGISAIVAIEPPGCKATEYSDAEISKLSRLPILVVFGDHLDVRQEFGNSWLPFYQDCQNFVKRVNAAGGHASMLHLPDKGMFGNSHMLMEDKNNLQVADLLIDWIAKSIQEPQAKMSSGRKIRQ